MSENEVSMAYIDTVADVTMLMIHGYPLNGTMWWPQINGLDHMARLIAPDLLGFGESPALHTEYSMARFADNCVALLDSLAIYEPIVLCGMSMGGYIAFEICRRHPQRVGGLILTATRAAPDSAETQQSRDNTIQAIELEGPEDHFEGLIAKLFSDKTRSENDELVRAVREMMLVTSNTGLVGSLAAMRDRTDSRRDLNQLRMPTLVIHGEEDKIVPVAEARTMAAAIPNAKFMTIAGAGHMVNLENPQAWNGSAERFLKTFFL